MSRRSTIAVVCIALCSGASVALAAEVRPILGPVILAKSGVTAAYIWDATAYVAQLSTDHVSGDDGLRAVEATATDALVRRAADVTSANVSISVVFKRAGSSAAYGNATFAEQQRLLEVGMARDFATKGGVGLVRSVADGKPPPQIKITVSGALPASQ